MAINKPFDLACVGGGILLFDCILCCSTVFFIALLYSTVLLCFTLHLCSTVFFFVPLCSSVLFYVLLWVMLAEHDHHSNSNQEPPSDVGVVQTASSGSGLCGHIRRCSALSENVLCSLLILDQSYLL